MLRQRASVSRLDSTSKRDRTDARTCSYATFLESVETFDHRSIRGEITGRNVALENFSEDIGGSRLKSRRVTDHRSHTRDEKGKTGSRGGAFASKRLFHDDAISRRGFF